MLTMPFHNVLRFYPSKTDPVVLTIGAGAAGNQHVCAFTRDGLELSLPLAGPPDERKLERVIRSLCCHERTLGRECHQWGSGDLMAYPDRKQANGRCPCTAFISTRKRRLCSIICCCA